MTINSGVKLLLFNILIAVSSEAHRSRDNNNNHYHHHHHHHEYDEVFDNECGIRREDLYRTYSKTLPGDWPWHVALFSNNNYFCGATLIDDFHVLTAAHCVFNKDIGSLIIQLGAYDLTRITKYALASDIVIHPEYKNPKPDNNIAMIYLAKRVKFNDFIKPICLWGDNLNILSLNYAIEGTSVGWGFQTQPRLKTTHIPIKRFSDCVNSNPVLFGTNLKDTMFCAGYQNQKSSCIGDLGGGLYVQHNNVWYLGGIAIGSHLIRRDAQSCFSKDYSVFLNVALYVDWIQNPETYSPSPSTEGYYPGIVNVTDFPAPATAPPPTVGVMPSILNVIDSFQNFLAKSGQISEKKCQEYTDKGWASTDGKRSYMRLYNNADPISDGRIISEIFIIFPAHEIFGTKPTHVEKTSGKVVTRFNVSEVIVHPDYVKGQLYNDLALVRLSENIKFTSGLKLLCLYADEAINDKYFVSDGDPMKIISKNECDLKLGTSIFSQGLPNGVTDSQFCINMCQTRKLAEKRPDKAAANLVGFLSYCTEEIVGTGVYVKIIPYIGWIERIVWNESSLQTIIPPEISKTPDVTTTANNVDSSGLSVAKCQEYQQKGFVSTDGKRTYIRLYNNADPISDGRFISENFVLFPAHEIYGTTPTHVEKTSGKTVTKYNVKEVIIHPQYVHGKLYNDFALIKLSVNVKFNSGLKLLCLYTKDSINDNYLVSDGDPMKIISKSECESKLSSSVLSSELPNGVSQSQFCISMCQTRKLAEKNPSENFAHLIGFLSYCTEESVGTGVYTKITPYLRWIESIVWGGAVPERRQVVPNQNQRISEKKCQEYTEKGQASADGKQTYMRLFRNEDPISDGRFISENFLIFPAHEVINTNPTHVEKSRGTTTTKYEVSSVIVHPNFIPGQLYNDFALVKLKQPAKFNSGTKMGCLFTEVSINENLLVGDGDPLKILSRSECEAKLSPEVLKSNFPNGITNQQVCINMCQTRKLALKNPALKNSNLVGFLSYCTEEIVGTGVYTRITPYLDWIENVVWPA